MKKDCPAWTPVRNLRDYQDGGELFGNHILSMEYYLVNLKEIAEEELLSTNQLIDNIMYCDKYRKKSELIDALQTAYGRVGELGAQAREEFTGWVKHILLAICGDRQRVVEEILGWNGEDDMEFKYNIVRTFEDERAEGKAEGEAAGHRKTIIQQVCRKLLKGKMPAIIAEELEEDIEVIRAICEAAAPFAPEYDVEQIYSAMESEHIK